ACAAARAGAAAREAAGVDVRTAGVRTVRRAEWLAAVPRSDECACVETLPAWVIAPGAADCALAPRAVAPIAPTTRSVARRVSGDSAKGSRSRACWGEGTQR